MTSLLPNQQLVLDTGAEQGFLSYLRTLPEKADTSIRFFDRQDYYTVHGQDALFTAKEFFKTSTILKYLGSGEKKVASCVLSRMNFESFLKDLLLVRQYRVEMYRNKAGKNNNWELAGKASPGNLQQFEEVLFGSSEMSMSAIVMAIKLSTDSLGQRTIGAAFADAAMRKLDVCEFADNDQFSNLEALLVQIHPKECLICMQDSNADHCKIKQVLARSNILITERKKTEFNAKDITQDLNRLLKNVSGNSSTLPELDLMIAMSCLTAVIKYLELLSDDSGFNQFVLQTFDLSQFMRLDAAAAKALNLFPTPADGGNKFMCLSGLLNRCKTAQGQRLVSQWIKQPLMDKNKIEERLNLVEAFFENGELRQVVQDDHLKRFPDISRLAKKFQRQKATLQDCVKIYQAVSRLPLLADTLTRYSGIHHVMIQDAFANPFKDAADDFCKFNELVETTVDLSQVENNEFMIKAEFDEGLQECKDNIDEILEKFPQELNKAARDLGLEAGKTVKLESNSQLGYFFRVTLKEEKVLRNNKKYFTIETRKDGCRFSNSSLKSLNDDFQALRETYNEVQAQLANEVIKVAAGYADPMQNVSDLIASLDVVVSFAHVASHAPVPYVRPVIKEKGNGDIILVAARHPCLELQDDVSFIANDVNLVRGKSEFQIITGPNMGGKSTYIRQVGVITLMAQIGSFVPCSEAEITITDSILARVGAGDSQLKGVSTFMSEMLETASILKSASANSLIIIDELGRGTSTYDGFGLAWAISEHIATNIKAFCLFATHFHELTALADAVQTVSNFHVTALTANGSLTLLYKVKPGVCDRSFGIHVAELAHFPAHVVEAAKRKAQELEDFQGSSTDIPDVSQEIDDTDWELAAKKRRLAKKEGDKIIDDFLQKVKGLLQSAQSDEEFQRELELLKTDIKSSDNLYLRELLCK